MKVKVLEEAGFNSAMHGIAHNFKRYDKEENGDIKKVADKLCAKGNGENKFLEQMEVWMDVTAPRYLWSELDTYRLASKSSHSTMHTLKKDLQDLIYRNNKVQWLVENGFIEAGSICEEQAELLANAIANKEDINILKRKIPESWIQTRMCMFSYKTLQNMYQQRKNHKLNHWQCFFKQLLIQVDHPEFIDTSLLSK